MLGEQGKPRLLNLCSKQIQKILCGLIYLNQRRRIATLRTLGLLLEEINQKNKHPEWIVIDEVQKVPRLLDVAHNLIEDSEIKFALTGSSSRKLKRGGANLLAGRAFVYNLFPLTHRELQSSFSLSFALQWGTLPKVISFTEDQERELFLDSYCHTYLKEEITVEQLVRNVTPFRKFLEIAALENANVINYSKIAQDINVDPKTVKSYFEILEDTLLGFLLPAYHRSIRKQQSQNPKFYMFDTGIKRALHNASGIPLQESSYAFGRAFEHFIVLEIYRLNQYLRKKFSFSYLLTNNKGEIDLIVERPGAPTAFVEIKSTREIKTRHISYLARLAEEDPQIEAFCFSRDPKERKIGKVTVLPWQKGLIELGL